MTPIKDNIASVKLQISKACLAAQRNIDDVSLLAVSKTKSKEMIEKAYQAGQKEFGESYVQESVAKIAQLKHLSDITWHFIGPVQSNKTKQIASNFSWVHSIDRAKIATRLNEHRSIQDTPLNVCLQVNISDEGSKSGISIKQLPALANTISQCPHLILRGLMAIPEKNAAQASFVKMKNLFEQLKKTYPTIDTLSMGMSGDMQLAITAGSTMVRVGSAIFGAREK